MMFIYFFMKRFAPDLWRDTSWKRTRYLYTRVQKVLSKGVPNLITFFSVDEGIEDPNSRLNGPSSAHQRNAIEMVLHWRADDGPSLNAGLVALWFFRGPGQVLLRNPIFLWFFRGVRIPCTPPPPPLDILWIIQHDCTKPPIKIKEQ